MKTKIKGVIFSLSEGFWHEETKSWVQDPKEATIYPNIVTWTHSSKADNAYNAPADAMSQVSFDELSEKLWDAIEGLGEGDKIAEAFSSLNDDEVIYEGDSFWLVNGRSCDDDNLQEMTSEIVSQFDRSKLALVYNIISPGYVWLDNDEGFIHCSEEPFS